MRKGGALYYLLSDHLGSTSAVADAAGNQVGTGKHFPYGGALSGSGEIPTDSLFTGQKLDSYINLYLMGARWYDPYHAR